MKNGIQRQNGRWVGILSLGMKLRRVIGLSVISMLSLSCGPMAEKKEGHYKAQVIEQEALPIAGTNQVQLRFHIRTVKFHFLEEVDALRGKHYDFFAGGFLSYSGSINYLTGQARVKETDTLPPRLNYRIQDGEIIPRDNFTLYALSTVARFDSVLAGLSQTTGIDLDEFLPKQSRIRIYHDAAFYGPDGSVVSENNAAYLRTTKSFLVTQPSLDQFIPLGSSQGVIAHELGHMLFEYLQGEKAIIHPYFSPYLTDTNMRGIDEGFADLFSWVNTGVTHVIEHIFVRGSKIGLKAEKDRDFAQVGFTFSTRDRCENAHYCVGTLFAHAFYQGFLEAGYDPKSLDDRSAAFKDLVSAIRKAWLEIRHASPLIRSLKGTSPAEMFIELTLLNMSNRPLRAAFSKYIDIVSK